MQVRQATLDDARHIVDFFVQDVSLWQRLDERGKVQDLPYAELTIYERWLHGGAWMSLETGAIWLNHLLSGKGCAYVMQDQGRLVAYAEAFHNRELTPMKSHLHLARIKVAESCDAEAHQTLADAILEEARPLGRLSVTYPEYDKKRATYFRANFGANEAFRLTRFTIAAQTSQSYYNCREHDDASASQIEGWTMAVGRLSSPRALWEAEWREHWRGIAQIGERGKYRQYVKTSGHEALVYFRQRLYNSRHADVYCWSRRHLSRQLLRAIRDLAHRLGFRTLTLALPEESIKLLPENASEEPNKQVIATANI